MHFPANIWLPEGNNNQHGPMDKTAIGHNQEGYIIYEITQATIDAGI